MRTNRIKYILMSFIMVVIMMVALNRIALAGSSNYTQVITPNPNISCTPGWCLKYVQDTFGAPAKYGNATAAWNNCQFKHEDKNFPAGCYVPIWFSVKNVPEGHVALLCPDGSVYSSSSPYSNTPVHHSSLDALISYYSKANPLTYLGWSEDIETLRVVQPGSSIQIPGSFTVSAKETFYSNEDVILNWTTSSNAEKYGLTVRNNGNQSIVFDDYVYGNQKDIGQLPIGNYRFSMLAYNSAGKSPLSNLAYFSVTAPVVLNSIAITTPATKLSYNIGDTLDITGLAVTGTYSDGSKKVESITTANVTGFNSAVAATDQVLTITVGGKTTTYKVKIVASIPKANIPVGTVIFGNGQALNLGYANNSAHTTEVVQDVVSGGGIYVKTFSGQVINNSNGVVLTNLSALPAVTYKDANGNIKHFSAGDGPEVTTGS